MDQRELYKKTDEIISKFNNGEKRYRESPTFNRVVQMLARDADPYEIIDQLINVADDSSKALEQYIIRAPKPERIVLTSKNDKR